VTVDRQCPPLFVFRGARVEPDLAIVEVHLRPGKFQQFTEPISDVVANNQERFEIVWQLGSQTQIPLVLKKTCPNIVFLESRNVNNPEHLGRVALRA
jgi:hypothetical protein